MVYQVDSHFFLPLPMNAELPSTSLDLAYACVKCQVLAGHAAWLEAQLGHTIRARTPRRRDCPLRSGCRRRVLLHGCQRTGGTLRCVGRPVVSAARPAVPSGEMQPAVDAERRGHRVHPPRCLSLPLSNTQGFLAKALGHQVGPTKANLLISDLFSRLSNETC